MHSAIVDMYTTRACSFFLSLGVTAILVKLLAGKDHDIRDIDINYEPYEFIQYIVAITFVFVFVCPIILGVFAIVPDAFIILSSSKANLFVSVVFGIFTCISIIEYIDDKRPMLMTIFCAVVSLCFEYATIQKIQDTVTMLYTKEEINKLTIEDMEKAYGVYYRKFRELEQEASDKRNKDIELRVDNALQAH